MTQLDWIAVAARKPEPKPKPEPVPAFVATSTTSRDAAVSMHSSAGALRERVRKYLEVMGSIGATDEEIVDALKLNPSTARPRRCELVDAGLVKDSGLTRPTRSGRKAVVWVAAATGGGLLVGP